MSVFDLHQDFRLQQTASTRIHLYSRVFRHVLSWQVYVVGKVRHINKYVLEKLDFWERDTVLSDVEP